MAENPFSDLIPSDHTPITNSDKNPFNDLIPKPSMSNSPFNDLIPSNVKPVQSWGEYADSIIPTPEELAASAQRMGTEIVSGFIGQAGGLATVVGGLQSTVRKGLESSLPMLPPETAGGKFQRRLTDIASEGLGAFLPKNPTYPDQTFLSGTGDEAALESRQLQQQSQSIGGGNAGAIGSKIGQVIGNVAPMYATGGLGEAGMLTTTSLMAGGKTYQDSIDAGKSQDQAMADAAFAASTNILATYAGIKLNVGPAAKALADDGIFNASIKEYTKQALGQGAIGAGQAATQEIYEQQKGESTKTPQEIASDILNATVEQAVVGASLHGVHHLSSELAGEQITTTGELPNKIVAPIENEKNTISTKLDLNDPAVQERVRSGALSELELDPNSISDAGLPKTAEAVSEIQKQGVTNEQPESEQASQPAGQKEQPGQPEGAQADQGAAVGQATTEAEASTTGATLPAKRWSKESTLTPEHISAVNESENLKPGETLTPEKQALVNETDQVVLDHAEKIAPEVDEQLKNLTPIERSTLVKRENGEPLTIKLQELADNAERKVNENISSNDQAISKSSESPISEVGGEQGTPGAEHGATTEGNDFQGAETGRVSLPEKPSNAEAIPIAENPNAANESSAGKPRQSSVKEGIASNESKESSQEVKSLPFKEGIRPVIQKLIDHPDVPKPIQELLKVLNGFKKLDAVNLNAKNVSKARGEFDPNGIKINVDPNKNQDIPTVARTIAEEATHAVLHDVLEHYRNGDKLDSKETELVNKLQSLLDEARDRLLGDRKQEFLDLVKKHGSSKGALKFDKSHQFYRLSDIHEFVYGVLGDEKFQEKLSNIQSKESPQEPNGILQSVWKAITKFLWGKSKAITEGTKYHEAFNAVSELMSNQLEKNLPIEDWTNQKFGEKNLSPYVPKPGQEELPEDLKDKDFENPQAVLQKDLSKVQQIKNVIGAAWSGKETPGAYIQRGLLAAHGYLSEGASKVVEAARSVANSESYKVDNIIRRYPDLFSKFGKETSKEFIPKFQNLVSDALGTTSKIDNADKEMAAAQAAADKHAALAYDETSNPNKLEKARIAAEEAEKISQKKQAEVAMQRATIEAKQKAAYDSLPKVAQLWVDAAREHIDQLTFKIKDAAGTCADIQSTLTSNLGVYLHRAYRASFDKAWPEIVRQNDRIMAQAQEWGASHLKADSAKKQTDIDIQNLLKTTTPDIFMRDHAAQWSDRVREEAFNHKDFKGEVSKLKESGLSQTEAENAAVQSKKINQEATDNARLKLAKDLASMDVEGWKQQNSVRYKQMLRENVSKAPITNEMVNNFIHDLLYRNERNIQDYFNKNQLPGGRDLSLLKSKKDLPLALRELWGEYTDPMDVYYHTASNMIKLISQDQFQKGIKDYGLQQGLMEKVDPLKQTTGYIKVTSDNSPRFPEFHGYYMHPDMLQSLQEFDKHSEALHPLLQSMVLFNGATTWASTIGNNPRFGIRNMISVPLMLTRAGHLPGFLGALSEVITGSDPHPTLWKALMVAREGIHAYEVNEKNLTSSNYIKDYIKDLIARGVLSANKMHDLLQSQLLTRPGDPIAPHGTEPYFKDIRSKMQQGLRIMADFGMMHNDIAKVIGYELEQKDFRQAHPDWTDEQVKSAAADSINNKMITPDRAPVNKQAVSGVTRIVSPPFITWKAENIRNSMNCYRIGYSEIQEGRSTDNNALVMKGMKALAGSMAANALSAVAPLAITYAAGQSWDQRDKLLRLLPEWQRNNPSIALLGKDEKGNTRYMDLSFMDPDAYWTKIPYAAYQGFEQTSKDRPAGFVQSAIKALSVVIEPFAQTQLFTQAVTRVMMNRDANGGDLYNPHDPTDVFNKSYSALISVLEPGAVKAAMRTYQAIEGKHIGSQQPSVWNEISSMLGGQRIMSVTPQEALSAHASQAIGEIEAATKNASSALRTSSSTDVGNLRQQLVEADQNRFRLVASLKADYEAVKANQGVEAANQAVMQSHLQKDVKAMILSPYNQYQAWRPSKQEIMKGDRQDPQRQQIVNEYLTKTPPQRPLR